MTLHLWTQVVGKTRLALAPMMNHWWQVPLYVTARGLGTSLIPFGSGAFEIEFDLLANGLKIRTTQGDLRSFPLESGTCAAFYAQFFDALHGLGVDVAIHPLACELSDTLYLDRDTVFRRYDSDWGRRFFDVLVRADRLFKAFRAEFLGKASPVHFFWGSFDLAVTRFSGRRAPRHPGGAPHVSNDVMSEAYSHEVSSVGFWPGDKSFPEPAFYSYAYPEPEGFSRVNVLPQGAYYDSALKEFLLPYEAVRLSAQPESAVATFMETSYAAAAILAGWPRQELERHPPEGWTTREQPANDARP